MKKFVIGDIHGEHNLLIQCLQRASFNYKVDQLICLGDVCDRGKEVRNCVDELLQITNLIIVLGNHDLWALNWATKGETPEMWLKQGGAETIDSYNGFMPEKHISLFRKAHLYYIQDNSVFVHAGFNPAQRLNEQEPNILLWSRALAFRVIKNYNDYVDEQISNYDMIYLGHTHIDKYGFDEPLINSGVCLMDTGAGSEGYLSIMNIESKEVFQSDKNS